MVAVVNLSHDGIEGRLVFSCSSIILSIFRAAIILALSEL